MSRCPICDQKPMNCDCSPVEKELLLEGCEKDDQIAELKALLGKVRHEIQDPLNECCTSYVGNRQCSNCERRIKLLAEIDRMV